MLKSPANNIFVTLDKAFEDEIITQSGIKLYKDSYFSPEWNTTTTGKVVAVPEKLTKRHDLEGLSIKVEVGDEIILSYLVVFDMDLRDRDTPIHHNLFYHEGNWYWKVDYYHVLGFVRGEKLVPAQGYIFCEELPAEKEERVGLIWMPEMTQKGKPKGKAKVIGVGEPLEGHPNMGIEEGEIVRFNHRFAQKYQVKGRNILILKQSQILATI